MKVARRQNSTLKPQNAFDIHHTVSIKYAEIRLSLFLLHMCSKVGNTDGGYLRKSANSFDLRRVQDTTEFCK
jgi:hypothetical protein